MVKNNYRVDTFYDIIQPSIFIEREIVMEAFVINGGNRLMGEVEVSGSKNAALPIIAATVLLDQPCTIKSVPYIKDINNLLAIIEDLGAAVEWKEDGALYIDPTSINTHIANEKFAKKLRASYYLLGSLVGRMRRAQVALPGGCNFGIRPVDQHLKGFECLGCETKIDSGSIILESEKLVGTSVFLDNVSVGATINIMLAAVKAEGKTTIENAAKEPHIVDVANFLNAMGANIKGAGTDVIKITGVEKLESQYTHAIIPDQIEAGTFMVAAAVSKGDIVVKNVIPTHLESLSAKLVEMGIGVDEYEDSIRVYYKGEVNPCKVKTMPHPGFPTDMQPIMTTLMCFANGQSMMNENVWEDRFQYVPELRRMGGDITIMGSNAMVNGTGKLQGTTVKARDLRAGAALVLAGLGAEGKTEVENVEIIDRGYVELDKKLKQLGAKIERISVSDD